jgi:hypothetical protein
MTGELVLTLLSVGLVASLLLTPLALLRRSWLLMWAAAALSLAASIITGVSIGPFIFLVTALQFAAAVALRWVATPRGWAALLLLAGLVWALALPVQIALGWLLPWVVAIPLVVIAASVAILVPRPRYRR